MDRPVGPRQPTSKRHTAYEDIFGPKRTSYSSPVYQQQPYLPQPPPPPHHIPGSYAHPRSTLSPHPPLTPAQAYQAQIYLNQPPHPLLADPPRLGVRLDHDQGRLGLDFATPSTNSSDHGTDDDSSELPWARNDHPGLFSLPCIYHF